MLGKTPYYGLHITENRYPTVSVRVKEPLHGAEYGALGYVAGAKIGDGIPIFSLKSTPTEDELKHLGAALAASGAVALFHVLHVTPEQYILPPERQDERAPGAGERRRLAGADEVLPAPGPDTRSTSPRSKRWRTGRPPGHHRARLSSRLERGAGRDRPLLRGRHVKKETWVCTGRSLGQRHPR